MTTFTRVIGNHYARADATASILRMVVAGMPLQINSGYRSDQSQENIFFANYTSNYNASSKKDRRVYKGVAYYRRNPYHNHVAVAVPGTSNHRSGLAVDFGPQARAWLFKHGADHGWVNPAWAKRPATLEPWHWEYNPKRDKHKTEKKEELNMALDNADKAWLDAAIRTRAREAVHDYYAAVNDRDTSWARSASDMFYNATRSVTNRMLQTMADGSDSGGRSLRDRARTVITGSTSTAATGVAQVTLDTEALATAIAGKIPAGGGGATPEQVRTAIRDVLGSLND